MSCRHMSSCHLIFYLYNMLCDLIMINIMFKNYLHKNILRANICAYVFQGVIGILSMSFWAMSFFCQIQCYFRFRPFNGGLVSVLIHDN